MPYQKCTTFGILSLKIHYFEFGSCGFMLTWDHAILIEIHLWEINPGHARLQGLRTTHDDFIPSSILLLAPRIKIPRWNTVWKADFITIVKGTEYVRFFEHTVFFVLLFAIAPSSSVLFQSLQFPNTDWVIHWIMEVVWKHCQSRILELTSCCSFFFNYTLEDRRNDTKEYWRSESLFCFVFLFFVFFNF